MTEKTDKFELWAVVEIMGHKKFAGFVTEQTIAGTGFLRVDVPEVLTRDGRTLPPFTKIFGTGSIYGITPCTEETAKAFAVLFCEQAFHSYEAPRLPAPVQATDEAPDWESDPDDNDD